MGRSKHTSKRPSGNQQRKKKKSKEDFKKSIAGCMIKYVVNTETDVDQGSYFDSNHHFGERRVIHTVQNTEAADTQMEEKKGTKMTLGLKRKIQMKKWRS